MRDVQPVLAAEREVEVVARDARDLLRLEPEQLPDAVVLVDDVVADAQVGEARERAAEPRVGARRPLAEDLRVGQQDEAELAPDEARGVPARPRTAARVGRQRSPALEQRRVDLSQQRRLPLRLAAVGERDDDAVPGADEARELVLGLGEPARGDRGRCASNANGCPCGNGSSSVAPSELERGERLLLPDLAHVVRLPDEVRRPIDGRDEIVGADGRALAVVVAEVGARRGRRAAPPRGTRRRCRSACAARAA